MHTPSQILSTVAHGWYGANASCINRQHRRHSQACAAAGNLLKPMLGRGELRCIGATTLDEYRKYIEKDPALERRFQQVYVDQPSVADTVSILRGLRER